MASVTIENVHKSFDDGKAVLNDISFCAQDGEFISLLGPSGCGKTTLLRIIAGLEQADSGAVRIADRDVTTLSPKDRNIAMVFQSYALYPHLNVEQNIGMGLKLRGTPPDKIRQAVRETAATLGLEDFLARMPSALSGGQRQRVALARALVRRPSAYLLDEPLSNLDAVLRDKTRSELKLLFKRVRGTVLYVTHDQVEAMTLSDRIVVLHQGEIQQIGTPDDIYRRPANVFVASFLGSPAMNIFSTQDAARCGLISGSPSAAAATLGDLCGIRPENIEVAEGAGHAGSTQARVLLAEPTGANTILSLEIGELSLRASIPGSWPGGKEHVDVRFPPEALHYFRGHNT